MIKARIERNPVTKVPKKIVGNVINILSKDSRWEDVIAFDEFSLNIVLTRQPPQRKEDLLRVDPCEPWSADHTTRTIAWIQDEYEFETKASVVDAAVSVVARQNPRHPVRDYFMGLTWDGAPRVDTFFSRYCGAEDSLYTRDVARVSILSSVARILTPGCKVDTMPVLEGDQGLKKSTAIQALVGAERFCDTDLDLSSKDAYLALLGIQVYELAEFDKLMVGHEAGRIKSFMSSSVDRYRPPYGKHVETVPRQCIFWGTTNHEGYLRDETGGRRFLPVTVKHMDIEGIRVDRDQIWAEAYTRRKGGEQYWPDDKLILEIRQKQDQRFVEDSWESHVREWLISPFIPSLSSLGAPIKEPLDVTDGFTLSQALAGAVRVPVEKQGKSEQMRMTAILKRCNYSRSKPQRDGERLIRKWRPSPPETTPVATEW